MTKVVEFEAPAAVERQAREWLIRLDGDSPLSGAEVDALRAWLGRSPSHREELTRISKFWEQANVLTELAVPLNRGSGQRSGRRRVLQVGFAAATVAFASAGLLVWWLQHSDGAANGTYGTAIGQQQTLSLPDGSSIQLNTDSQVQIDYGSHLRRIRLLRGEALFAVTPNPTRPFDVYAANGIVHAVGTAFSVHLEGSRVDVTVTKGIVDVSEIGDVETTATPDASNTRRRSPRRLGQLKAGQTAIFGSETQQIAVRELADPSFSVEWRGTKDTSSSPASR